MNIVRTSIALAATAALQQAIPAQCSAPLPDDGAGGPSCPASAPASGCACEPEGALGCTDDGYTHDTAFVCQGGVWVDLYNTDEADELFCPDPALAYNFCAWVEGEVLTNCTLK